VEGGGEMANERGEERVAGLRFDTLDDRPQGRVLGEGRSRVRFLAHVAAPEVPRKMTGIPVAPFHSRGRGTETHVLARHRSSREATMDEAPTLIAGAGAS